MNRIPNWTYGKNQLKNQHEKNAVKPGKKMTKRKENNRNEMNNGRTATAADAKDVIDNDKSDGISPPQLAVPSDLTDDTDFIDVDDIQRDDFCEETHTTGIQQSANSETDGDMLATSRQHWNRPCEGPQSSPSCATPSPAYSKKSDGQDLEPEQDHSDTAEEAVTMKSLESNVSYMNEQCSTPSQVLSSKDGLENGLCSTLSQVLFSGDGTEDSQHDAVAVRAEDQEQREVRMTADDPSSLAGSDCQENEQKIQHTPNHSAVHLQNPSKRLLPLSKNKEPRDKHGRKGKPGLASHQYMNTKKCFPEAQSCKSEKKDTTKSNICVPLAAPSACVPQSKPSFLITDILSDTYSAPRKFASDTGVSFELPPKFSFTHPSSIFCPEEVVPDNQSDTGHSDKTDGEEFCDEGGRNFIVPFFLFSFSSFFFFFFFFLSFFLFFFHFFSERKKCLRFVFYLVSLFYFYFYFSLKTAIFQLFYFSSLLVFCNVCITLSCFFIFICVILFVCLTY